MTIVAVFDYRSLVVFFSGYVFCRSRRCPFHAGCITLLRRIQDYFVPKLIRCAQLP